MPSINSSSVTGVEISCSIVPLSHSRAMVKAVRNDPDDGHYNDDNAGYDVDHALKVLVEPRPRLYADRRINFLLSVTPDPVDLNPLGIGLDHSLAVCDCDVRSVAVRRIDQRLYAHRSARIEFERKVMRNDNSEPAALHRQARRTSAG